MEAIWIGLEKDYSLTTDVYKYLNRYEDDDEVVAKKIRFESVLLRMDVEWLLKHWDDETKVDMQVYCEKRLAESQNIHLKVKYGWNLWVLTGKSDYPLLNKTIDNTLAVIGTYQEEDDYKHASVFCDYVEKICLYTQAAGKKRIEKIFDLINSALRGNNRTLQFHILAKVYYLTQKANEYLLNNIGVLKLAEVALKLVKTETVDTSRLRQLEFAVFYADRTNVSNIMKEANEMLGDYKMSHLYADEEKNIAIGHLNDHLLIEAMTCFKKAGNKEKLKKATLAYEKNKTKLRYLNIPYNISVERRNKEIDVMNKYIVDVVEGGTTAILDVLFGKKNDVFMPAVLLEQKVQEQSGQYYFQKEFGAVNKDTFQNSRNTTHDKNALHMMVNYAYSNMTFHVLALVIYNGLKEGTLSYDILKGAMLESGFAMELNKYNADGTTIGSTYFDRVDIGIKDFLRLLPESIEGKEVDWRYCISFLTTQFEGLFREVVNKRGIPVDRLRKEGNTELMLLEGLLNDEQVKKLFTADDLMLFKQTLTKDGYNIRNEVAHGMYVPQEFTNKKALLVFLCILRLSRAMK